MLLAIVLDVYSSIKDQSQRSETLYEDAVALMEDIEHHLPSTLKQWEQRLKQWEQRLPEKLKNWGLRLPKLSIASAESHSSLGHTTMEVELLEKWMEDLEKESAAGEKPLAVVTLKHMLHMGIRKDRAVKLLRKAYSEYNQLPTPDVDHLDSRQKNDMPAPADGSDDDDIEELVLDPEINDPFKLDAEVTALEKE